MYKQCELTVLIQTIYVIYINFLTYSQGHSSGKARFGEARLTQISVDPESLLMERN